MSDSQIIDAMARAMWDSDPRVKQVAWAQGDPQTKDLYRILASAAKHAMSKSDGGGSPKHVSFG
jgi:hypothetical protein